MFLKQAKRPREYKYCRYQSRQGAYFVDCTNIKTSSLFTVYGLRTQCIIQKCMKSSNICSFRLPVLTVLLRIAHSTIRPSLRGKVSVSILSLLSQDYFTGSPHICVAEPKVNCTSRICVLFTKRRVGGIYSILLSFFWSYSQHFWIKDRNKKGRVFMLYICV